ncbi:MAG: triose-phosphate isomerase [Actinobacteria bacterium]|nr:triose-phosphate isomerase [Actinomycetota bacterium]
MTRKPIIAANWKMHHDHFTAIQFAQKFSYLLDKEDYERVDIAICPPFTDLRSMQTTLEADRIPVALGAQNCYWEKQGAFTGEISPTMLVKLKVSYVIVGHSERREIFGETDEMVNRKVRSVLEHQMTPIVCVGETLEEREAGATQGKVLGQVAEAFAGVKSAAVAPCVVAYEPIWAIGTGRNATPEDAQETIALIRGAVAEAAGAEAAEAVRIQYGGSVKPGNIAELMAQPDIDGALVGGASLDPEDFARVVRFGA